MAYYDEDYADTCCPSCCRAADLGTHDYCVPCRTNPCCPTSSRVDREELELQDRQAQIRAQEDADAAAARAANKDHKAKKHGKKNSTAGKAETAHDAGTSGAKTQGDNAGTAADAGKQKQKHK